MNKIKTVYVLEILQQRAKRAIEYNGWLYHAFMWGKLSELMQLGFEKYKEKYGKGKSKETEKN